jgi:hypothetical protein
MSLSRANKAFVCVVVACCLATAPTAGQEPIRPEDELAEYTEVRLQTARIRIEPTAEAEPGECLELGVSDLKVSLRGTWIEDPADLDLERERRPTLHALLIDTSGSMRGKLRHVRRAAAGYVRRLDPEFDRGLVATFDESFLLITSATADREELLRGVESSRMSLSTTLNDSLYYVIQELDGHHERLVILLLSDGIDTNSLYERHDVLRLIESRPGLSVFSIGLTLPYAARGRPAGINSVKKYLYQLANRTNGKFFDVPVGSRLDNVYLRIREMLENEATLTVVDPDTEAPPGKIKVSSRNRRCKITVFKHRRSGELDPSRQPIEGAPPELPVRYEVPPPGFYGRPPIKTAKAVVDPVCAPKGLPADAGKQEVLNAAWYLETEPGRIHGCTLDLTMEYGLLYQPRGRQLGTALDFNDWLGIKTRPFEIDVPPLADLPPTPVAAMEALADLAVERADEPIEIYPLNVPVEIHARPYHDYPLLVHGTRFLEMRPRIARALYAHDEYREWVVRQLREEADLARAALKRRYQRSFPEVSSIAIEQAIALSDEGKEIARLAAAPSEVDLRRHLVAWLGDISAHDLFVAWETEQINAMIDDPLTESELDRAVERWVELRRIFWVPSYTRVLTLLSLTHDPHTDRIGFWRVTLPRPGWLGIRPRGYRTAEELADIPLDLVPDLPLGLWTIAHIHRDRPELAERIRESHLVSVEYTLTGKPRHQQPIRAFRDTRVELVFETPRTGDRPSRLTLVAHLSLEKDASPTLVSLATVHPDDSDSVASADLFPKP